MNATRAALFAAAACAVPGLAVPHPHAFLDTDMALVIEDGMLVRVDLTWTYDAFTTLFLLEDRGLDADGDGVLTEAERDALFGFDARDWPEGFAGDLFVEAGGAPVALGDPVPTSIAVENGQIVAGHSRPVDPVPAGDAVIRQYDPTYYIAYTLKPGIDAGPDCTAKVAPYDADAAEEAMRAELSRIPEDRFEIMQVGHLYSDTVTVTCAPSS